MTIRVGVQTIAFDVSTIENETVNSFAVETLLKKVI